MAKTLIALGERRARTAHHETGHTVGAAIQQLKLRPEGLSVDARGEGLACYHKEPDDFDQSRERVVIATFAGYNSEIYLCEQRGYAAPEEWQIIWSPDSREARHILARLSCLSVEGTAFQIEEQRQDPIEAARPATLGRHLCHGGSSASQRVGTSEGSQEWKRLATGEYSQVFDRRRSGKFVEPIRDQQSAGPR